MRSESGGHPFDRAGLDVTDVLVAWIFVVISLTVMFWLF